jgi:hypothetical protein
MRKKSFFLGAAYFSNLGFIFEIVTPISCFTYVCDRYLHFPAAIAGNPAPHEQYVTKSATSIIKAFSLIYLHSALTPNQNSVRGDDVGNLSYWSVKTLTGCKYILNNP